MNDTNAFDSSVKMVSRIAFILRTLSERDPEGLSLSELVLLLDLRKPTAHRLLAALMDVGFVFQDLNSKRYRLGSDVIRLGQSAAKQFVGGAAKPVLRRLAAETGDTVFASIMEGATAICVAREIGSFPIRTLTLDIGDRRPLGVGAGSLAILAFLSDDQIESALSRNAGWLADYPNFTPEELINLVARTRRDGYALNAGRIIPGMNAIGVPVQASDGTVLASLSIAAIKDRMGLDRVPELVAMLQLAASELASTITPEVQRSTHAAKAISPDIAHPKVPLF